MSEELKEELFYFYHIPKTGGFSIHDYLESVLTEGELYPGFHLADINFRDSFGRYKYLSGHFGNLPIFESKRNSIKISTLFRDPVIRGISHYQHVKRDASVYLHDEIYKSTLKKFINGRYAAAIFGNIQCLHLCEINPQAKKFLPLGTLKISNSEILELAIDALDLLDVFGVTERHDEFLFSLAKSWNLPLPEQKIVSNAAPVNQVETIDKNDIELIQQYCQEDIILYNHIVERLSC